MHQKPANMHEKTWQTAQRIIAAMATVDGQVLYGHRRRVPVSTIAEAVGLSPARVKQITAALIEAGIVCRQVEKVGGHAGALTWVCDPREC